jgi:hypothetical protein
MWRCGDVHGSAGQSLCVWIGGPKQGEWWDFAAGHGGDMVHLVAAVLYGGSLRDAYGWARHRLGLDSAAPAAVRRAREQAQAAEERQEADAAATAERVRKYAHRIWLSAQESILGTPVAAYLLGRGIDVAELGRQPRALRYHPALHNQESGRAWPAMVAAISDAAGRHVATHRTWLEVMPSGNVRKAPVRKPKMVLGAYAGACIRLWRGGTGRSLREAREGEAVDVTEGIEDGLSVALVMPERRVLVAISLSNMGAVLLPPAVHTVRLWTQNDKTNAALLAADRAERLHLEAGRAVELPRIPREYKDVNDMLRGNKTSAEAVA